MLAAGAHRLLLSLPSACLAPTLSRQEAHIGAILRNLMEDTITLEAWMESEIRNSMSVKGVRDPYAAGRPYSQRNPLSRYDDFRMWSCSGNLSHTMAMQVIMVAHQQQSVHMVGLCVQSLAC